MIMPFQRLVSVAPMMEYTDRNFRYFIRCISKKVILFTEMITSSAIVNGDYKKLLEYNENEHPIVAQIGGSDIRELVYSCKILQDYGFDEINLNIGCPSNAVQKGGFGARLMLDKHHVANIISTLQKHIDIPLSVKCRLGVDNYDSYKFLYEFVDTVSLSGCKIFYIHARKALLNGISPKDNRRIPKLDYDKVYRLKKDFPNIEIILNGGIQSLDNFNHYMNSVDGIMIGRAAYKEPYLLSDIDNKIYNCTNSVKSIQDIAYEYLNYATKQTNCKLFHITKHMQGLWHGKRKAALFRKLVTSPDCNIKSIENFIATHPVDI